MIARHMSGPLVTRRIAACDCIFEVRCDAPSAALASAAFGGLMTEASGQPRRRYEVRRTAEGDGFTILDGVTSVSFADADALLFHLDKELTLSLQRHRADLLFVHASVVVAQGRALVLPATAGTGKSTLTLAAVARGLSYSSDELAPIDLTDLTVSPYPRALTLKMPRPHGEILPPGTLRLDRRILVPSAALPGPAQRTPVEASALIFLRRDDGGTRGLQVISQASAAARLMENVLNGLAHEDAGLTAAARLSQRLPAFELQIENTAEAVEALLRIGQLEPD
jgi:hypothetical protein